MDPDIPLPSWRPDKPAPEGAEPVDVGDSAALDAETAPETAAQDAEATGRIRIWLRWINEPSSDTGLGADRFSRRRQDDAAQPAAQGPGARRHGRHHQRVRRRRDRPSAGREFVRRRHPACRRLPLLHRARRSRRHARRSGRPAADRPHRRAEAGDHRDDRPCRSGAGAAVDHGPSGAGAGLSARRRHRAGRCGERRGDARRPCRGGEAGRGRRPHRARQDRSRRPIRQPLAALRERLQEHQPVGADHRRAGRRKPAMLRCSNAGSTIPRPRPPTSGAGSARRPNTRIIITGTISMDTTMPRPSPARRAHKDLHAGARPAGAVLDHRDVPRPAALGAWRQAACA